MHIRDILGTALVVVSAGACATASPDPFGGLDRDADDRLDRDEFTVGAHDAGHFAAWDTNRDMLLDEPELRAGYMAAGVQGGYWVDVWDLDEDGRIAEEELYEGTFETLDRNDDDYLDAVEFEAGLID